LLVGSKGHRHADDLSDDDLEVVLTDKAHSRLRPSECIELLYENDGQKLIYDTQYTNLSELLRKPGSPHDLDHWPYQRGQVLYDRDGSITGAHTAAGIMPEEFRRLRLLHATIDAGIAARRAEKTLKRGFRASEKVLVARGVKALSRLVFGLEGRWVPLDHWMEAELTTLEDVTGVRPLLLEAAAEGKYQPILEALPKLEDRLFVEGVPRPAGRRDLFFELVHPSRAHERAIHGLY
jgi:hypothetical protein